MDGLQRISRYKSHLMGIAILTVVYGHLLYYHADLLPYEENNWTEWYTLGSVEMFLFVSGFGIYQSLRKSRDALAFYRRRLGRLLPAYLPVIGAWCAVNVLKNRMLPSEALGNLTALGYWFQTGNQFNWYVPATLVLYLLSPLFFDLIEQRKTHWAMAALILVYVSGFRSEVMMALTRFPTYLLGMWFGAKYARRETLSRRLLGVCYAVGIAAMAAVPFVFQLPRWILWYYGCYWNLFVVAAPFWMLGITRLLELQERSLPGKWVNRVWNFFGVRSFEIYLCHLALYDSCLKLGIRGWVPWICIAVAGTLIGIAFHQAVVWCQRRWNARTDSTSVTRQMM